MDKLKLKCAFIVIATILFDQLTKAWTHQAGMVHFNRGFIMGLYADLPASIRIIALGIFAGFIFFFYIFILHILPKRASLVSYALSLLVGGISGNVIDKITMGHTIDFIPLSLGRGMVVFNLADVFQWLGGALILWVLIMRDRLIWYHGSTRKKYLVLPQGQIRMAMIFFWGSLACAVMLGLFSYAFLQTLLHQMELGPRAEKIMLTYILTYSGLSLMFCMMAFLMGLVISHRTAGSIYALERYMDELFKGADHKFKLRDGDNYQHIEKIADKLRDRLK